MRNIFVILIQLRKYENPFLTKQHQPSSNEEFSLGEIKTVRVNFYFSGRWFLRRLQSFVINFSFSMIHIALQHIEDCRDSFRLFSISSFNGFTGLACKNTTLCMNVDERKENWFFRPLVSLLLFELVWLDLHNNFMYFLVRLMSTTQTMPFNYQLHICFLFFAVSSSKTTRLNAESDPDKLFFYRTKQDHLWIDV